MTNTKRRKLNIPFCVAVVLLFLTLVSIHFTSGLYARYTVSDTSDDSARAATFGQITLTEKVDGVVVDPSYTHIVVPGVDINKQVHVDFTACEVDTYVFVVVTKTGDWSVSAPVYDTWAAGTASDGKPVLKWEVGTLWEGLEPSGDGRYVYCTYVDANNGFSADFIKDNAISVNEFATEANIENVGSYGLKFSAAAVQAGGFGDASDAWLAIKDSVI
ncbi:MAG: hypothetical protein E7484_03785 [Ruminococcaceae bacterium]|nr:hypothetical protein [Oscillospiraceae bacterium]